MTFDLTKPIYAKDKDDGKVYLVDAIYFPLEKPSGKDITIDVGDGVCEWRSINDVELFQHDPPTNKNAN